ncbi:DUF190 domain-containing protein [Dendrosporobacter sp. 1207_IL3150]|uniref:DUF190 domain-containing protein n=1 Tax=Dendrosporobacter sp. 1207_IL3150 TaxID=3084054 RepID=UPI002FDA9EA2
MNTDNPQRLCIYLQTTDKFNGCNVANLIAGNARQIGCSEINVYKGISGFGASKRLYLPKIIAIVNELPLLIEVVGRQSEINKLLKYIDKVLQDGTVTIETIEIYKKFKKKNSTPSYIGYIKDLFRLCRDVFKIRIFFICISFVD